MVTSAAKPGAWTSTGGNTETSSASWGANRYTYRGACPRCGAQLRINYDEPGCLQCGFVDYEYTQQAMQRKKKSIVGTGTHYVLRYVGESVPLSNILTHVKIKRIRNRVMYGVNCPFCDKPMSQSSLSGKRREEREERYKCTLGHRVSITPNKDGDWGWK